MRTTGKRGFAFTLDLAIALLAVLLMGWLMVAALEGQKSQAMGKFSGLSLERKTVTLLDSMVKNRNEANPMLGAASLDWEKRRVNQNEMDLALLAEAEQVEGIFVKRISLKGFEKTFQGEAGECIALDRIVNVNGILEKLEVVACEP